MISKIILLVLCSVGLLTGEAKAQLFLEQGKIVLAVSGGDHINGSFLIHNTSSDKIIVKAYWEDFEYKAPYDGTKEFLPAGTAPMSASQWVTFSPQNFTLPAFGRQIINYTVTVPSTIKEGHYGVLFFERGTDPLSVNDAGLNLIARVGCLFFIEPKDKNKKAVLQDLKISKDKFKANFVNQCSVVLIPHTTYYVMQGEGMVLLRGDAKNLYVPPAASAPIEISLKSLKPGKYTLVVNSDMEDGDVVVKEIGLSVDATSQITIENSQD